jgi:signal transduction histidine kinase
MRRKKPYDMPVENGLKLIQAIANDAPGSADTGNSGSSIPVPAETDRWKRQEEELMEAKAEAEFYLDLVSHDIRNLIQIGVGYIELAQEISDPDEIRSLSDKALETMYDAAYIIDNVRKLQALRHGSVEIKTVNLCGVLSDLRSRYSTAAAREINIVLTTISRCQVQANEHVTDIFNNLITNSIRHSDPGKLLAIDIRVDRVKEKDVDYLRCIVEDNGPGISNWVKDRIFMRFQRGDTKAHGKGLGLHIAKTLVESYGGKIWVEDRVSGDYTKGARFVVVLPAA